MLKRLVICAALALQAPASALAQEVAAEPPAPEMPLPDLPEPAGPPELEPPPFAAPPEDDHSRARDGVDAGEMMPLQDILDGLRARFPGHQIGVDGPHPIGGGRYGYAVKWLTDDGRVLYIYVDAHSGDVISVQGD